MPNQATYDDANLILRLYEIRREDKMRAAREWFVSRFHPKSIEEMNALAAPGSAEHAHIRQVTSYFEMVASFVTAGILNQELYFQSGGELLLCYIRVKPVMAALRELYMNPDTYKNLETVGEAYLSWYAAKGESSRDAIVARMS